MPDARVKHVQVVVTEREWKRLRIACRSTELTQQEFVRRAIEEMIAELQANKRSETNRRGGPNA